MPQLVNMVSEVQEVILPKIDGSNKNDPNVLIADAVLNAIGLTSYELSDQVDFDSWFTSLNPRGRVISHKSSRSVALE